MFASVVFRLEKPFSFASRLAYHFDVKSQPGEAVERKEKKQNKESENEKPNWVINRTGNQVLKLMTENELLTLTLGLLFSQLLLEEEGKWSAFCAFVKENAVQVLGRKTALESGPQPDARFSLTVAEFITSIFLNWAAKWVFGQDDAWTLPRKFVASVVYSRKFWAPEEAEIRARDKT